MSAGWPGGPPRPDGQVRRSQVLTTYGPGSLLDLPDEAAIVAGLEHWLEPGEEVHEPRLVAKLARLLDLPELRLFAPPAERDDPAGARSGIAVWRFPRWTVTRDAAVRDGWRSRLLVPRTRLTGGRYIDEERKRHDVLPIRFVRACRRGHIGDIDWYAFAHAGKRGCMRELRLEEQGTTGDLGEVRVRCACGAERRVSDATAAAASALGSCDGWRPWLGPRAEEPCTEPNRLLLRHASNAYFAQAMSVISLPDPREALRRAVDAVWGSFLEFADSLEYVRDERRRKPPVRAALAGFSDEEVFHEVQSRRGGGAPAKGVKQAELEALLAPGERLGEDGPESDFFAEELPRSAWESPLLGAVERVLLVHRLREVTAQVGFTRFESSAPDVDGELEMGVRRAPLSREAEWLPAVENRGEGVFVGFRRQAIADWLLRPAVVRRGQALETGFARWKEEHPSSKRDFFGLPYVLLHSLAHMLVTQVALTCGYPASAVRERVYTVGGYGILLFTASPDAEGTLGGLVDVGRGLRRLLAAALDERGRLCSNDPVCAQHDPASAHEQRFLLGAACHGCLLIAEPSCEQRNDFLDRALVVPTVGEREAAFFDLPR